MSKYRCEVTELVNGLSLDSVSVIYADTKEEAENTMRKSYSNAGKSIVDIKITEMKQ